MQILIFLYKKGKENCRCDNFLAVNIELNETLHSKYKSNLANGTLSSRVLKSHHLHRVSRKKRQIFERSEGHFRFLDGNEVTLISKTMCCKSICRYCSVCYHMFSCTCYDYGVSSLICTHIHSVAQVASIDQVYEINAT